MLALLLIDHRLAFLALATLLIAAAIPLAYAWACLLPEEPPPFPIESRSFPEIDHEPPAQQTATRKRDTIISVALLTCLTVAYVIRFPGFPTAVLIRWLDAIAPGPTEYWAIFAARIALIVVVGATLAYTALRPVALRAPLAAAATLVLILWFLAPLLRVALLSAP